MALASFATRGRHTTAGQKSIRPAMAESAPTAVLFTQHLVGLGTRKAGLVPWAEALARKGWDTHVVTTQLSLLSVLARAPRLQHVPSEAINRWHKRGENLKGFVWVAPLHPARTGVSFIDRMSGTVFALYPYFVPRAVKAVLRRAQLVVLELGASMAMFDVVKRLAPQAKVVYYHSDRLEVVPMHPMLQDVLRRVAPHFDLVRVHARSLIADLDPGARVLFIPQGVDKKLFDRPCRPPYPEGSRNAVVAGDMLFDGSAFAVLVDAFPNVMFHAFGRMDLGDLRNRRNVTAHGEVSFERLVPFLLHADVGLAPYIDTPAAHYLVEGSLKLTQYTYCRLPVVAPHFATAGELHIMGYNVDDRASIMAAMEKALAYRHLDVDRSRVIEWDEVIERVLCSVGLGESNEAGQNIRAAAEQHSLNWDAR